MRLFEIENKPKGVEDFVVIYGGRFQPPHPGHKGVYDFLVNKFGKDRVYIATSDKTDFNLIEKYKKNMIDYDKKYQKYLENGGNEPKKPVFPEIKSFFNFNEKKLIWNKLLGVDEDKIIFSKTPAFTPLEFLNTLPDNTGYIAVAGEKDLNRYKPPYFLPLPETKNFKEEMKPYAEHGYFTVIPMQEEGLSATQVRKMLSGKNKEEVKKDFEKIYKKFDQGIFDLITNKLGLVND